jgi:hypothetical protein
MIEESPIAGACITQWSPSIYISSLFSLSPSFYPLLLKNQRTQNKIKPSKPFPSPTTSPKEKEKQKKKKKREYITIEYQHHQFRGPLRHPCTGAEKEVKTQEEAKKEIGKKWKEKR